MIKIILYDILKKNSRFSNTCHNCECAWTLHENIEGTEKVLYCYYNNNLFSSKPFLIFKEKFIAHVESSWRHYCVWKNWSAKTIEEGQVTGLWNNIVQTESIGRLISDVNFQKCTTLVAFYRAFLIQMKWKCWKPLSKYDIFQPEIYSKCSLPSVFLVINDRR